MKVEASTTTGEDGKINATKDETKTLVDVVGGYKHVPDGTIYFRLFDEKDTKYETPLGETKVIKNTVEPTIAKVSAERNDTNNATVKATRYGTSDITTIYYCAVPNDAIKDSPPNKDAVSWNAKTKIFSKSEDGVEGDYTPVTRKIEVKSDSIDEVINGLDNSKAYRIYYVVENSYGSQTELAGGGISLPQIDIGNDVNTTKEEKVDKDKITLPTGTITDTNAFKWQKPHSSNGSNTEHGYIVTLYKDGNIYYEAEVSSPETGFQLINYKNPTAALEAGEYYIGVVTKGSIKDSTKATVNSEEVISEKVTVKAINPVSNIKLTTNESNGYPKLSWDENDENCGGYSVKLYLEDKDTGVFGKTARITSTTTKSDNKWIDYSTKEDTTTPEGWSGNSRKLDRNYGYYAEVVANVDEEKTTAEVEKNKEGKTIYVNSQPEYYYFCAPYREAQITSASDSSMTFKLEGLTENTDYKKAPYYGETCVYGEEEQDLTYALRVYKKIDNEFKDMGTKEVKTAYEYSDEEKTNISATYFTVEGLDAYTEYQFRLITKCGEFEGWSEIIANGHTMPRIDNLTCEDKAEDCKDNSNTFFFDSSSSGKIIIDGKEYKGSDFTDTNLQEEFKGLKSFLSKLKAGDEVTITGDTVDLVLNSTANDSEEASFMYNEFLDGKVLNITGNNYERKIGKPNNEKYPAEVNLKSGQFDLTKFKKESDEVVTLGNGVKIKTGTEDLGDLIVVAGAEVTVNDVKMKTDLQTVIKTKTVETNGVELTVVANGEESNNLVFENQNDKVDGTQTDGNVTIKFVSSNTSSTTQQGSITIKGNGGKVTVTQENVAVGSDIEVKVEKGEVDVSEGNLTGGKTVTLSATTDSNKTAKITAITEAVAPEVLKGKTIEIKDYTIETLKTALNGSSSGSGTNVTEATVNEVNAWLAKFGVNAEGVKVTVNSSDGTKVTIENSGTSQINVQGLK